jgi:Tfp pilus assembly protein PilO
MRLKILLVPFFLVMSLILIIGYMKPDFDSIAVKKAAIVTQDGLQAQADTVAANVKSLNNSLDREQESENFMLRYLPMNMNQEQAIDAFNFLASQFGIITLSMDLKKNADVTVEPIINPDGTVVESSPEAKTFLFSGEVLGSYSNIKAFFNQLSHIGRFQKVQVFSIERDAQSAQSKGSTDLRGKFTVDYGYLPKARSVSALTRSIFQRPEFNFAEVAELKDKITKIPELERGPVSRPNPFQ